jgi:hypothetical protein
LVITVDRRDARAGLKFQLDASNGDGDRRQQEIRFVAPLP